ncbi:probable LRR receptor-like serine/threonine-protein kinase RKF3 [Cornus florida]|uniref:probable LRR receptor-like serine/threonine-protein kinase RKF3 n=1 Tax=Cornus florida TaxID=4283 RepID=UPI00289730C3|nr:probable LRR receptor-like serine/threonine-protein kinase RKF3 [Cornus florida]
MSLFLFMFLGFGVGFSSITCSESAGNALKPRKLAADSLCPFNFDDVRKLVKKSSSGLNRKFIDVPTECYYLLQGFRIHRSQYLRSTGFFTVSPNASYACWDSYQMVINEDLAVFDVRSNCGVQTSWISNSCVNISTEAEFEGLISEPQLQEVRRLCNQSLGDSSHCETCVASLSSIQEAYFHGSGIGNVTDCFGYPFMYAAALANQFGPVDLGTIKCLFSIDLTSAVKSTKKHKILPRGVVIGCVFSFSGVVALVWFLWRWHKERRMKKVHVDRSTISSALGLGFIGESITLVKFTIEEMKEATRNFSWGNLIGKGGYGNVYRGVLADGSEVALKRFKNCSISGDAVFTHEVEVIASVRHVNLVAFRGYCTATDPLEGHRRIIVCDLMRNGSLYDHLFGSQLTRLSWPIRRKVALGTARGLAYLHNSAQPAIIHRDVKASNILLDDTFEPKLADFGLAKFTPDGLSHLSTKVAGTLGYVSPEYALFGQLTERSDVFSFGVVLLELLSGKNAVLSVDGGQAQLLTDWAWSQVREGRVMDVIEKGIHELGLPEVMENYVLIAVLCTHSQLYARPTMEQVVKILESNHPMVARNPDRPLSFIAEISDIERSLTCTRSGSSCSLVDQQPFKFDNLHSSLDHREDEEASMQCKLL